MKTEQTYNLAFIGAGLSCSYSLIHFIQMAENAGRQNRYKILIIDKSGEFWTGIPYGVRSGFDSLIITSLKEFLPPAELGLFLTWLKQNFEKLMADAPRKNGRDFPTWVERNKASIAADQWEKIFIPRYLFGIYLGERMKVLLQRAVEKGILVYDLLEADVTDVQKIEEGYQLSATQEGGVMSFKTGKVVLAIGSPPKRCLNNFDPSSSAPLFIEDMYDPNLQFNLRRINESLESSANQKKNILILGSNASALEIVYNLYNTVDLNRVKKVYVISPDGAFPNRIKEGSIIDDYQPVNLTRLKEQYSYTSAQILEAVKLDTESAQRENISVSDIYHVMAGGVIALMNKLSFEELKKFVCNDGVEIGKFQRRAGGEYLDVVDELVENGKIHFVKGKFVELVNKMEDQYTIQYFDQEKRENVIFKVSFDIIINCIGFQEMINSSSSLLRNLTEREICLVNSSKRGLEVSENFECSTGFFVVGPMLAGNLNSKLRVWHAESCSRLYSLSQQLAEVLIRTMA